MMTSCCSKDIGKNFCSTCGMILNHQLKETKNKEILNNYNKSCHIPTSSLEKLNNKIKSLAITYKLPDARIYYLDENIEHIFQNAYEIKIIDLLFNKLCTKRKINKNLYKMKFLRNDISNITNIDENFINISNMSENIFMAYVMMESCYTDHVESIYYKLVFTEKEIKEAIPCLNEKDITKKIFIVDDEEFEYYYNRHDKAKKLYSLFYVYEFYRNYIINN